jgi:uncharacterized protein (DUF952 family)
MTAPEFIYHLCPRSHWTAAQEIGSYTAPSLETEGFIHCSLDHQVEGSLNLHFRGQTDLMLLKIDPTRLSADLRYEPSRQGELFPHLYGALNLEAVVTATPLRNKQG